MIKAKDAIASARSLIGTPYSELDCINLIKKVIRSAPGGVKTYTTAGTNALWDSYNMSAKYRDLTWRQEGLSLAAAGMIAFKADGTDFHHAGIVTDAGTVVHSSSTQGGRGVVETPLTAREGWTHLAVHRYIETSSTTPAGGTSSVSPDGAATFPIGEGLVTDESGGGNMEAYKARVKLNDPDSTLNVRSAPGKDGDVINRLFDGQSVTVLAHYDDGWMFVQYGDSGKSGYVSGAYIEKVGEMDEESVIRPEGHPVITDDAGNTFIPVGGWRVEWRND